MSAYISSFLQGRWLPDNSSFFTKQNNLVVYLVVVALTSLLFYLIPSGYYNPNANLIVAVITLVLLPLAWYRPWFSQLANVVTLISLILITYIATQSGGVNSNELVWHNMVALPVLLLLGPRATLIWIGIILVTISGLLLATLMGWVGSSAHVSPQAVPWVLMNHAVATGNLMLGVRLYDHLHEMQLKQLQKRNEEIKATHQALLKAQAHKDEFMAAVGHELRTPMNAILGFNGVLREELADSPEQLEVVDHIRRSTAQLLQVVNEILDFSQLQAGKMQLYQVDFDLAATVQEVLETQRDKAEGKGISLGASIDPALPVRVRTDRQRLMQILRNLLDNALKFTDKGSVQLRFFWQGPALRAEVIDTGCGIALPQQTHIFRRFEHADVQTTRAYGGTGLGLSICEKLVALLGGQIGVISSEGHGATFWFEIPLEAVKTTTVAPQEVDETLLDNALRILVVDDNATNLMVARLQLQKCWPRAHITTADGAAKALEYLQTEDFDVALVDMVMPDMDGMQLTQEIRRQFPAPTTRMPIIALTANTNPVDRQRCLDAGMDDVLGKPMELAVMMRSVGMNIQKARKAAA